MREPRQLHHQQEHQQPDDVVVLRERALRVDGDAFELVVEIDEGDGADAEIDGDQQMVGDRRQPFVEVVLLVHEENLQGERDRHHPRDELQRPAETGIEEPDQPDELNRRQDERQIIERGIFLERFARHASPLAEDLVLRYRRLQP